jgi:hypothetical protein
MKRYLGGSLLDVKNHQFKLVIIISISSCTTKDIQQRFIIQDHWGPKHFKESLCATFNICPIVTFTPCTMSKPSMVEGDDQPHAKNNEHIVARDVFYLWDLKT